MVQYDMSMRANLLAGIAVLLMATSAAHAYPTTPEGEPNPLELPPGHIIARVPHKYGEPSCKLDMEVVRNRLHTRSNCWEGDTWLRTSDKEHGCPFEAHIDKVERQDDTSFLEYASCGSHTTVYLHTLEGPRGSNVGIYRTENW
jgi:hypothetical protein